MTAPARLSPSRVEEIRQRTRPVGSIDSASWADVHDLLREVDRVSALLRAPEVMELARDLRVMACVVGQAALDTGESTGPADLMSKAADLLDALRAEGGETR